MTTSLHYLRIFTGWDAPAPPVQVACTGTPMWTWVCTNIPENRYLSSLKQWTTASSSALGIISGSCCAGNMLLDIGWPHLCCCQTTSLEWPALWSVGLPLTTFKQSLTKFLQTLFLETSFLWLVILIQCPWSDFFYLRHWNNWLVYVTLLDREVIYITWTTLKLSNWLIDVSL